MRSKLIGWALATVLTTWACAQRQEGTVVLADAASRTLWVQDAMGQSRIGHVAPAEAAALAPGTRWSWTEHEGVWQEFWPAGVGPEAVVDAQGQRVDWAEVVAGPAIVIFTPWHDADAAQAATLADRLPELMALRDQVAPEVNIVVVPLDAEPPSPATLAQRTGQPWATAQPKVLQRLRPTLIEGEDLCQIAIYARGNVQNLRISAYWNSLALLKLAVKAARD
ncbi:MAG: hypothetical protein Q7P63_08560 [Verrucomicrobiota bacterium JB022]|nr:hypothetical protein [Verrucomicrobiota bacterium JB022]